MKIESIDVVILTSFFILPGFLINEIIDATNPPKKTRDSAYFLKCLFYSLVHITCWSWAYILIMVGKQYLPWEWFILITFVGAPLIALLIAKSKQNKILYRILARLKFNVIHPTPSAWDYCFSNQKEGFIVITLIDNTKLHGWYSSNSFTSSDPDERDIFVEKFYNIDENGEWNQDKLSNGFYIPKDQIRTIEFRKGKE